MEFVADLTLILLAAIAGGFLAQRAGQPLIVGYILAGVAVGPFTGGPTVGNIHDIEQLAELGVALLLFSLGLELSFRELKPVRTVALFGATIQIILTIALGLGVGLALGWAWRPALWLGALISLSSTMVALKTIQAQGRLGTLSSRVMLGILVVQDLAVVPLMIVLPELSDPAGGVAKVGAAALRASVLLGVIVLFSTRVVPRLMGFVARRNSRELFFLSTMTLAVGVGYVAYRFGLSMALGAFVAGLVVNESDYAHQALSDVAPLRDLFGMLFFVSVGMLLDPVLLWKHLGALAIIVAAIVVGKATILALVVRAFGYWNIVPLAVGLTLFQVGEFAFVLARVGRTSGAISNDLYALTMNAAIITMALTPVVSGLVPAVHGRFWPRRVRETHEAANLPAAGLSDHVVIAGAGRVGRSVADALSRLALPFVLIESDDRRGQQAREAGLPVIYGDASQPVVLEAAALQGARAMLVTVPAFSDVRSIVAAGRRLRPDLPVMARADSSDAVRALYASGIQEVTSPEVEAAIEMTRQALMYFNVPPHDVLQVASAIRHERYDPAGVNRDSGLAMLSRLGEIARHLEFTWVGVPADSPFDGRTLSDLRIRTATGASVVGIIREGALVANPDGQARLEKGDLVAVLGTRDQIARFEQAMRAGTPLREK
ncbi:MAG: portal protein [Acidobacteria bacterium RIFCSPLOWO2_02_FULL_67_36]|nr:MAG: portal protein [Acidobacteria bacterium RIFCSPLOWO2_02_FULL_67_36]OFW25035.1 MAG: portal protein [Acidobacteria bacterium RIFCSPLOWO2_12_FULL_66_21]